MKTCAISWPSRKNFRSDTPHIVAVFLLFGHNQHELPDLRKQMADMGVCVDAIAPVFSLGGPLTKGDDLQFNKYQQNRKLVEGLRRKGRKLKPCTWLHYSSTMNPGGSISPCCMVANESSDFGRIDQSGEPANVLKRFYTQWNGLKYKAARRLFDRKSVIDWVANSLHELTPDGMGLSQAYRVIPMICKECPIPEDLETWSTFVSAMYRGFAAVTLRNPKAFELRSAVRNGARTTLLGFANLLQ